MPLVANRLLQTAHLCRVLKIERALVFGPSTFKFFGWRTLGSALVVLILGVAFPATATTGAGAGVGVGTAAGVVAIVVDVDTVAVLTAFIIEFVAAAFTDDCTLAIVDGVSALCTIGVLAVDVVDTSVDEADSIGLIGGNDCTITGFSMFIFCFSVDSGTTLTAGISLTIFAFGAVDFCVVFGADGTTMTGFGIGIECFDNDCETGLNNPSVLIRILGGVDRTGFIDDEPAVEVFFDADLLVRASLFFRSFFGFTTFVTSTSIPFDSSSSNGKKRSGSTPTSISVTF